MSSPVITIPSAELPPRGPSGLPMEPGPGSSAVGEERVVRFEGSVQLFISTMPESSFVDFSDAGTHPIFACCWIDGGRGETAHVTFSPGEPMGRFKIALKFRDNDFDKVKLQISMRMRDGETGNRRTVPLCSSCAFMQPMLRGEKDLFQMPDQFIDGSYARVSMSITNVGDFQAKPLRLRASNLDRLPEFNKHVAEVTAYMQGVMGKNNMSFPQGSQMKNGETSRDFAGRVNLQTGVLEVPDVRSHYAIMSAQQECVRRPIPLPLLVYHMYLKVIHSGMTAQEVLALPDENFGKFFPEGLQINCDAGIFPYEKDFVPGLSLSFFEGVTVAAVPTENMAWPLSMGQFDGRTIRDLRPIRVGSGFSMTDLMHLFKQPPLPPGAVRALNPDLGFTALVPCEDGVLPELYLQLHTDDCESSALFGEQAKQRVVLFFMALNDAGLRGAARADALEKECKGWKVFKEFTPTSWGLMIRLLDRGASMLHAGHLKVMTTVGLATNASAADEVQNKAEYCGHCFNVGTLKTPSMSKTVPFLLEGTSSMISITVTENSPRVTATVFEGGESKQKIFDMVDFLSALSSTVMGFTQVINAPHGGMPQNRGWPLDVKVTGWMAKTCVSHALDSAASSHLSFYSRIMYMGWPCTTTGLGCMPVQQSRSKGVVAGCHPFDLTNMDICGVDAALQSEGVKLMTDIMEETVPPQVRPELLQKIVNLWLPCRSFENINTEAIREPGVEYHRIVVMESPCAPEYLSIIHEAKSRLVAETNRINTARADSDKIHLTALLEGTSALVCLDVPHKDIPHVTVIESMKQAMQAIGWPCDPTKPRARGS